MTNFEKWKKKLTLENFVSYEKRVFVGFVFCENCPAKRGCKDWKKCREHFRRWGEKEAK